MTPHNSPGCWIWCYKIAGSLASRPFQSVRNHYYLKNGRKPGMRKDTKARDFSRKAKEQIAERDSIEGWPCCVFCGAAAPAPLAFSNAHFIARSQGGLGIPENGLTLCPECHRRYDQTTDRKKMREYFREYLKSKYENWSEEALIYRKE